ncbi:uncharacterized protein ntf4 [Salarias fasciatus]|uniref:Neurotrophin-4 n=1 Tax=Salarias fasciatus TaxID=181472 RepID=A0A672FC53_SALFA|nr:uncharacterized protein LOC115387050 [Salarias fasciatus]XP_029945441.1 uncharacterized protein LOC115387050 [Salarias fasciatus]XP_029945442.1 uncharacterized protein LOC115387050 [Salarias fasciatus]XP_029945443.1 uncharacterized protein LOC115387050 [Salarias fasciatus]
MHWLPLVAMVIASALPFPHNPVSRIAAATTEPGSDRRREPQRHEPAARTAAPPLDHSLDGNSSHADYNMAAAPQDPQNQQDYVKSSWHAETSTVRAENQARHGRSGSDGALRMEGISQDQSGPQDYRPGSSRRPHYSSFMDFSKTNNVQDPTNPALQFSAAENHDTVSPAVTPEAQRGPTPTASSGEARGAAASESEGTAGNEGTAVTAESLTLEAALGLEGGLDGVLEGDEMFLDAHPRVLFSPSPSPPEHPPLLLMLETGLLEDDGDREEQEDLDRLIEGHGDRALDRSTTPSWASSVPSDSARPVKRDKRSHLVDKRRGEKSVCESESLWNVDKKTAIDSHGQKVTILQEIQTQTGPLRQYFYETRCRQAEQQSRPRGAAAAAGRSAATGVAGAGCLGVDKRQWLSECKAKQSFVRALTKDANSRIGWRWIRIDSSCVCVLLSRTNQPAGREVLTGRGKG